MPWLQLILESDPSQADMLADCLTALGAGAVTLEDGADQPLYEPPPGETPLWSATRVIGLFDAGIDSELLINDLADRLGDHPLPPWRLSPLEDKDWIREWMDSFHPMQFGNRLWICPSWHTPPHPEDINILLDPGLAFGTGTHPTTALCLQWLDQHGAAVDEVVDYGCGSGILAIAAAKLGAKHVWAVDNDPQALIATRDNAVKNQVSDRIEAVSPQTLPAVRTPLLLANILAQPLMELADKFSQYVVAGGNIVLSGILTHQAEQVSACYQPWFEMQAPTGMGEWVRLTGQRRS